MRRWLAQQSHLFQTQTHFCLLRLVNAIEVKSGDNNNFVLSSHSPKTKSYETLSRAKISEE